MFAEYVPSTPATLALYVAKHKSVALPVELILVPQSYSIAVVPPVIEATVTATLEPTCSLTIVLPPSATLHVTTLSDPKVGIIEIVPAFVVAVLVEILNKPNCPDVFAKGNSP